jgi:hypothetical protein
MRIYTPSEEGTPDLNAYRGRVGLMNVDDLKVEVRVTDARLRFGHLDLLVTPVSGQGTRWIEQHRIELTF